MWNALQVVSLIAGLGLVWAGNQYSNSLLMNAGIAFLGLGSVLIGWEGILTQRMSLGSRRRSNRRTYIGLAAVLQGIQFNVIGLFLIGCAGLLQLGRRNENLARDLGLQIARRPGPALAAIGLLLLLQSAISFAGTGHPPRDSGSTRVFRLLIERWLPGAVLLMLGLALAGLGFFEMAMPAVFDALGGNLLEALYRVR